MHNVLNDQCQAVVTHYMYLGLLPFFAAALGPWVLVDYTLPLTTFFLFYSVIILVFLTGALWAIALFTAIEFPRRHIHIAILLSLWPLISNVLSATYAVLFMGAGFLLLLFWEKCFIKPIYPQWYQSLRHKITFIVVACHMLVFFNLIR